MKIVSSLPPTIVHTRADIAKLLTAERIAAGMTCEAFDYHAGFSDRYVSKMENGGKPGMRQGFHIEPDAMMIDGDRVTHREGRISMSAMAEVWLDALGVSLVLMRTDQAEAIGAAPATAH